MTFWVSVIDTARLDAAAADAIHAAVRRAVFERLAGWVILSFPPAWQRVHRYCPHRSNRFRPESAGSQDKGGQAELGWRLVHLPEAIVADDDVQVFVGVDERTRHVVQRKMEAGLLLGDVLPGVLLLGDMSVITVTTPPASTPRQRIR